MAKPKYTVVPDHLPDSDAAIRSCPECGDKTWHVPQKVLVFSASGARTLRLWACENHPLPETVSDTEEETT